MRPRSRQREKITAAIPCDDSTSVAFVLNSDDNDVAGTMLGPLVHISIPRQFRNLEAWQIGKAL